MLLPKKLKRRVKLIVKKIVKIMMEIIRKMFQMTMKNLNSLIPPLISLASAPKKSGVVTRLQLLS